MHSLCYCVYVQVSFKLIFIFFCKGIVTGFNVAYICVLPQTFIKSNLKWIKKNSQIYFANMGYCFIESRGEKSQYLDVIYEKFKMKQHIYE